MIVSSPSKAFCAGAVLFVVVGAAALHAAPPPVAKSKTRLVDFAGDSYEWAESPQGRILTLTGNARIWSDDTTLRTDLATLNQKTSVANSPGKVRIDDTQNSVVGDHGVAYYKTRDAKITGNVLITVKPKQQKTNDGSVRNEFDAPVTINCENGDYNWRDRIAVATGRLTLRFKDYTVTADKAVYSGNEDKVTLNGNVHYTRANRKDNGSGPTAVAIITEGKESLKIPPTPGGVRGTLEVDDEETPPATPPASPKDGLPKPPTKTGPRGGGTAPQSPASAPIVPPSSPGTTPPPAETPSAAPPTP